MSVPPTKESSDREFCPAVNTDGTRCDFVVHPGAVHWTWRNGYPHPWQALPARDEAWRNQGVTEDPLRDAPQALRNDRGPHIIGLYVDELSQVVEATRVSPKGAEMVQRVQDLLKQGRMPAVYNRPLVEAVSLDGRFAYGLLETSPPGFGVPVVHETMPESGDVPQVVAILADSIREVFVPGHRGDCHGSCTREGMDNDGFYPECWEYDAHIATGIAARYRAWKDWVQ